MKSSCRRLATSHQARRLSSRGTLWKLRFVHLSRLLVHCAGPNCSGQDCKEGDVHFWTDLEQFEWIALGRMGCTSRFNIFSFSLLSNSLFLFLHFFRDHQNAALFRCLILNMCFQQHPSSRFGHHGFSVPMQVRFQRNSALFQGNDLFLSSLELCKDLLSSKEFHRVQDLTSSNDTKVLSPEIATSPSYLVLRSADSMCLKNSNKHGLTWLLKDCEKSLVDSFP